jgi:hypothetical protein
VTATVAVVSIEVVVSAVAAVLSNSEWWFPN